MDWCLSNLQVADQAGYWAEEAAWLGGCRPAFQRCRPAGLNSFRWLAVTSFHVWYRHHGSPAQNNTGTKESVADLELLHICGPYTTAERLAARMVPSACKLPCDVHPANEKTTGVRPLQQADRYSWKTAALSGQLAKHCHIDMWGVVGDVTSAVCAAAALHGLWQQGNLCVWCVCKVHGQGNYKTQVVFLKIHDAQASAWWPPTSIFVTFTPTLIDTLASDQ